MGKKCLEDICLGVFKLLTGLPLSGLPSAYSFCNLELHAIAAYSGWNRGFQVFGPLRASNVLKVSTCEVGFARWNHEVGTIGLSSGD